MLYIFKHNLIFANILQYIPIPRRAFISHRRTLTCPPQDSQLKHIKSHALVESCQSSWLYSYYCQAPWLRSFHRRASEVMALFFLLSYFACVYPAAELLTAGLLPERPAVVLLNPWIHAKAYRAASYRVCSPAPTSPLVCHMQQSSGRPPI